MRRFGPHAFLVLLWAGTWAAAAVAGVPFTTWNLGMWHFISPALLRHAPVQSLFYLNSQPPLLNAVLAAALALLGNGYAVAMYLLFAALALVTVLATAGLVTQMTGSRKAGVAAGAVLMLSPSLICYGHIMFYPLPTACLTVLAAYTARRAAETRTLARFIAFGVVVAAMGLLWAAFHPILVVATSVWFVWAMKGDRRKAVAAAAIPVVLVGAVVVKNAVLFDVWGTSSWAGMNLARASTFQLPKAERMAMVKSGQLSEFARVRPFARLRWYRWVPDPKPSGVPLLDQVNKSDGKKNLHNQKYIPIAKGYMRDALTVIRSRPGEYLSAVAKAFWLLYLYPASDFQLVTPQRKALGAYAEVYQAIFYARPPDSVCPRPGPRARWNLPASAFNGGVLLKLWFLAVLLVGPWYWIRRARAGRLRDPDGVAFTVLVGSLVYITLVCSLFEIGENQRFRFTVEPTAVVLAAVGITFAVRRIRTRLRERRAGDSQA